MKLPYIRKGHNHTEVEKSKYLKEWQEYGNFYGYELLTTIYEGALKNLIWKDSNGNIFRKTPNAIKTYGITPNYIILNAQQKTKEDHLNELRQIAISKGGKILSEEYINCGNKIKCEDSNGNIFYATPSSIKSGQWSPFFTGQIAEEICRQAFEFIFNTKFPSTWNVIKRNNKKNLQLDGYNDSVIVNNKKYKIAFEYQGSDKHKQCEKTIERDLYKLNFCNENNIILIIIQPFSANNIHNPNFVLNTILNSINEKINISINNYNFKIDYLQINHNANKYEQLKEEGLKNGCILLEKEYKNCYYEMEWLRIEDSFTFKRSADKIKQKGFPDINNKSATGHLRNDDYHLEIIKQEIKRRGGTLITDKWFGVDFNYHYLDNQGNNNYIRGSTAILTARKQKNVQENKTASNDYHLNIIRQLIERMGGTLITDKWQGHKFKYHYQDNQGNYKYISGNALILAAKRNKSN